MWVAAGAAVEASEVDNVRDENVVVTADADV